MAGNGEGIGVGRRWANGEEGGDSNAVFNGQGEAGWVGTQGWFRANGVTGLVSGDERFP